MSRYTRRTLMVIGSGVCALALAASASRAGERTLTITSFGGAVQEAQRKAFFQPFAKKYGVRVVEDEWHGDMAKLRAMVQSGNVTWDVLDLSDGQTPLACDEGLIEPLDVSRFGGRNVFVPGSVHRCGIGVLVSSIVYGYDDKRFPREKPSTLGDFWDVKRFPGPRAMKKWPKHNLEFALLADGVPRSEVYKLLGTEDGIARAFRKLDEIKPHVKVWFTSWAEPQQLLASGEVAMSIGTNGRLAVGAQEHPNIKIVWDHQGQGLDHWAVVKGSKSRDLALEFIRFASLPEVAAELPKYILYAPAVRGALDLMPRALAAQMPTAPQNAKTAWNVDSRFWGDHQEDLEVRFQAWLAK